MELSD